MLHHRFTHDWYINIHNQSKRIKSYYVILEGAIKDMREYMRWRKLRINMFLCIFDHWALLTQTACSLRAASVTFLHGQGCRFGHTVTQYILESKASKGQDTQQQCFHSASNIDHIWWKDWVIVGVKTSWGVPQGSVCGPFLFSLSESLQFEFKLVMKI